MTWVRGNKISIQGVSRPLRVRGLIPREAYCTSATLEQRNEGYFPHTATYQNQGERVASRNGIGIDAVTKHQLTLSNGLLIDEGILPAKKVRRLNRELSRRSTGSQNRFKTDALLDREYCRPANQRSDIRNKIASRLLATHSLMAVQDDSVAGWQRMWGTEVTASAIGGIMSGLNGPRTRILVRRSEPTTRRCSRCEALNGIGLDERIYHCDRCDLIIARDLGAAVNHWKETPAGCRESTPVDMEAATELMEYFGIPGVSASLVEETVSRLPATEANVV